MNPIHVVTGGVAALCGLLFVFSLSSRRPVFALACFATACGALQVGQQVG